MAGKISQVLARDLEAGDVLLALPGASSQPAAMRLTRGGDNVDYVLYTNVVDVVTEYESANARWVTRLSLRNESVPSQGQQDLYGVSANPLDVATVFDGHVERLLP